MDTHEIYRKAVETYGIDAQRRMAVEEMAELTNALMKQDRGRNTAMDVIDEIADVTIMMQQLAFMYGREVVQERIEYKTQRLAHRLNKED